MNIPFIEKKLETKWLGKKISYKPQVDSTNIWGLKAIDEGASRGEIFLTDFQTRGRGRLDRIWESPEKKNILLSFIDILPKNGSQAPHLTLVSGVGFFKALKTLFPSLPIKLKWPNDIVLDDVGETPKKLGGILCLKHEKKSFVVIGFGLNVNCSTRDLSPNIQKISATLSDFLGHETNREEIVAELLFHYEKERFHYDVSGLKPVLDFWKKESSVFGKKVRVCDGKDFFEGRAVDLDPNGFLMVESGENVKTVVSGDVTIL